MKKTKRYTNVKEMVRDICEDTTFAKKVIESINERTVINQLMALRAAQGLSQLDIARKMKCSQSRISKLEAGNDAEMRMGDFHKYADALGLKFVVKMTNK